MNGISSWFRQFSAKLSAGLRSFMAGRYGTDRLNMVILCAGLFCSLLSVWVKAVPLNIIFWALSYGLMIWAICRTRPGTPTGGIRKTGNFSSFSPA